VKELLKKGGADPNAQDNLQHTPFMMAAWFGKIDAAREIFEEVGREGGKEGGREGRIDGLVVALGGISAREKQLHGCGAFSFLLSRLSSLLDKL